MSLIMCFNRGAGTGSPGKYLIIIAKGQLISKADWRTIDPPKNIRTTLFSLPFYSSLQTNQICPYISWENLRRANLLFGFILPLKVS